MPKRLICNACGHLWHSDVLEQKAADRCPFCAGELVAERPEEPRFVVSPPATEPTQPTRER